MSAALDKYHTAKGDPTEMRVHQLATDARPNIDTELSTIDERSFLFVQPVSCDFLLTPTKKTSGWLLSVLIRIRVTWPNWAASYCSDMILGRVLADPMPAHIL